ncbi:MAG: VanZ family protein [Nitrosomonadales bacterium]|nr:VanZ family protein [Nitrosomonadales bacterium]
MVLQYRSAWLAAGWLLVSLVIYLSLTPHPPEPLSFNHADKLEHGLAYASLSLWFCQIYLAVRQRAIVVAALVMMGVALEFMQGASGYRMFEAADMIANSCGVLFGFLLARTRLGRVFVLIEAAWR